jgi:hypothetical protein
MRFTLGCDPEIFAHNGEHHASVIGLIGGSKYAPLKTKNGWVQEDNVAAEINIKPAKTSDAFSRDIENTLDDLREMLAKYKLRLSPEAYAEFKKHELEHPEALRSGCDPDFNAWKDGMVNTPPAYTETPFRSCGGHVHIGCKIKTHNELLNIVKRCDLFLAIPAMQHESQERKQLYGKAGCYRPKHYGVEYRTLSNFWVFSDKSRRYIFNAVNRVLSEKIEVPAEVEMVINSHDLNAAKVLLQQYNIPPMEV